MKTWGNCWLFTNLSRCYFIWSAWQSIAWNKY